MLTLSGVLVPSPQKIENLIPPPAAYITDWITVKMKCEIQLFEKSIEIKLSQMLYQGT